MPRLRIEVQGVVQGVGFRPTVYRLALERGLTGTVWNHARGVTIEAQGAQGALATLLRALREEIPLPARVTDLTTTHLPEVAGEAGFQIRASDEGGVIRPVVPPDLAVCAACAEEMDAPGERRHRYPFTNCTYCGPRYSIIGGLPYDRPRTAMRGFPLCPDCAREYTDPLDRRFHAQPIACPTCGPRLRLLQPDGTKLMEAEAALQGAAAALREGQILALKGLGGYQLLVDATSPEAVRRLRDRKRREEKPFAVMFPTREALAAACAVSEDEWRALAAPEAPILLLRRRPGSQVVPGVAPGNPRLGAFLPYTPLHRLLLAAADRPLVCTSGNLSDEPMAFEDDEALRRLGSLADLFLAHDRPILRPVDDSVLRVDGDGPTLLRRARGFAPLAVPLPGLEEAPAILAFGAHQKATVALLHRGQLVMSQHLGDLTSLEGAELLERTVENLLAFFEVRPQRLACDLHPDYASTRLAERLAAEWKLPLIRVQHHHAHGAACAAEQGLQGPVLALAWDGTGLGSDGTLWGGEALQVDGASFQRVGHLKPFPLPGGEAAVREPRRSACGLLWACGGGSEPPPGLASTLDGSEWQLLQAMLDKGLRSPLTSSMGRLFDAVAALAGLHPRRSFEGQAAMALEFVAETGAVPPYPFEVADGIADPAPLVEALLRDLAAGRAVSYVSARFHAALAELALAWAQRAGLPDVVLSGGCFQNALLTLQVQHKLAAAGFRVHRHRLFPPNDGCISLGQAVVAVRSGHTGLP
ncbi:MAG TPA: carbamoyltransferase HypF [Geothrix sp.]|nr:carbamoyltransferase HypF [Geothrix sp.]